VFGAAVIIAGLMVFGAESLSTIGREGVGGDLLFVTAGFFWAMFGVLLRYYLVSGTRAVAVVGVLSVVVYAPLYAIFVGFDGILQLSLAENLIQVVVQGLFAGVLPIFLFARAVTVLGAGRAATFPALVPGFGLIIGYLALGVVPSIAQVIGLGIVVVGFRFVVR
jgi:drug/metabolite transporter (DMT)-like permease